MAMLPLVGAFKLTAVAGQRKPDPSKSGNQFGNDAFCRGDGDRTSKANWLPHEKKRLVTSPNGGTDMRKIMMISAIAATALSLAACQSKEADNVEAAADNTAQVYDDMADNTSNAMQEDALENTADAIKEKGDADADNVDAAMDNGTR